MKTGQKWLLGCGIGCGVLILLVIALAAFGFSYFRGFTSDIEESEQAQTRLDEQLGDLDRYVPPPVGAIPPDRLAVFLQVRTELQPWHATMTDHFESFPPAADGPVRLSPIQQVKVLTGVGGFFVDLGEFLQERNEILLERGMGLGEYFYIHTLVYHWWLGHNPIDGPELLYGLEHQDDVNIQFFDDDSTFGKSGSFQRYRLKVRVLLENQLAALDAAPDEAPPGFRDELAAEVASLGADDGRIPWEDNLPLHMTAGLEPYRERLEELYCPVANLFDMHDADDGARIEEGP
jgi:hypothetical protein